MARSIPARQASHWRWFPLGVVGAMLVVFAVNGGMIYAALHTFPGEAGEDGFDLSNSYNKVLSGVARQAALGWRVSTEADADAHPVLVLTDRGGLALEGAAVDAVAERPLGPLEKTKLTLLPSGNGRYVARETLAPGQWSLLLDVERDGETLSA